MGVYSLLWCLYPEFSKVWVVQMNLSLCANKRSPITFKQLPFSLNQMLEFSKSKKNYVLKMNSIYLLCYSLPNMWHQSKKKIEGSLLVMPQYTVKNSFMPKTVFAYSNAWTFDNQVASNWIQKCNKMKNLWTQTNPSVHNCIQVKCWDVMQKSPGMLWCWNFFFNLNFWLLQVHICCYDFCTKTISMVLSFFAVSGTNFYSIFWRVKLFFKNLL